MEAMEGRERDDARQCNDKHLAEHLQQCSNMGVEAERASQANACRKAAAAVSQPCSQQLAGAPAGALLQRAGAPSVSAMNKPCAPFSITLMLTCFCTLQFDQQPADAPAGVLLQRAGG
jgi:hypothetical protein